MVYYYCIRCGYDTCNKSYMRLHLRRKTICYPNVQDINLPDYIADIMEGTQMNETHSDEKNTQNIQYHTESYLGHTESYRKCKYCERNFKHNFTLTRHLKTCKEMKKQKNNDESIRELVSLMNRQLEDERANRQLQQTQHQLQMEQLNKQNELLNNRISALIENTHMVGIADRIHNNISVTNTNNINTNNTSNTNIMNNNILLSFEDTSYDKLTDQNYAVALTRICTCIQSMVEAIHFTPLVI